MRTLILYLILLSISVNLNAQGKTNSDIHFHRNYLSVYIGMLEYNFNFERNLFLLPKSYTNIRFGLGQWTDLQGDGVPYKFDIVHLIGRKLSHIELNLGLIYLDGRTKYGNFFRPDVYAGYRLEELDGDFILRAGFSSFSFFNVGIGFKF